MSLTTFDPTLPANAQGKVEMANLRNQLAIVKSNLNTLLSPKSVLDSPYKLVASHCRAPEVWSTVRQICGYSIHKAGQDLDSFAVEFANFATNSEQVKASSLQVFTGVEYPIGSGNIQVFSYGNDIIGSIGAGNIGRSNFLELVSIIPKNEWFRLWHWHHAASASDGIPTSKGLPSAKFGATKGLTVVAGGQWPQLNYPMTRLKEYLDTLTNTSALGDDMISPFAIIATPKVGRTPAWGIIGDSRSAGNNAKPTSTNVLNGVAERVVAPNAEPFLNCACSSEQYYLDFVSIYFQRRFQGLRYVDKIMNVLGTNDSSRYPTVSAARDLELMLLTIRQIIGKPLYAMTVPYQTTSSDYFATLANQTVTGNNSNYDNLNAYRLTNPDGLYVQVLDAGAIVSDSGTKKWKVGSRGRTTLATMTAGSNIITFPGADLTSQDDAYKVVIKGVGTSNGILTGWLTRTGAGSGLLTSLDGLNENSGLALNAVVTPGASQNIYMDIRKWTNDGIHDNIFAADTIGAALAPTLI